MTTQSIEGAMPPLPAPDVVRLLENEGFSDDAGYIWAWFAHGYDTGMEPYFSADTLHAYAAPLLARVAELQAELGRARSALENISEMTYDSWTNGARAKQIADAALAAHKEQP